FAGPHEDPRVAADRVVSGAGALLETLPRFLAAIPLADLGMSFIARQLNPQEDKLEIASLKQGKGLREIAERVGYLVGRAHLRAARHVPGHPWTEGEMSALLDHALELAGLFESIYLAYSRLPLPKS